MLGFTLSKFSLLILVVAIFSIAGFFTLHLTESLKMKALTDMLAHNSTIASEMMSSPSYCDILLIKIPETVSLANSEMHYLMRISSQSSTDPVTGRVRNFLVFSASDKSKPDRIVAASSSPTTAEVFFYERVPDSGEFIKVLDNSKGIVLDPSGRSSSLSDAFYLVKEISNDGTVNFYVFSCAISGGLTSGCEATKAAVGAKVWETADMGLRKFKCDIGIQGGA